MFKASSSLGVFVGHATDLTRIPRPARLWRSLAFWISSAFAFLILAAVPTLVVDYWFLDSLGRASIFWTNFTAQLALFSAGVCVFGATIAIPIRRYSSSPALRKAGIHVGLWIGIFAGWRWSTHYEQYLLALNAGSFGTLDPLFGHDYGFYVFTLPAIETTLFFLTWLGLIGAACAIAAKFDELLARGIFDGEARSIGQRLGLLVTTGLNFALFLLGASLVTRTFLSRYGLLFKDNAAAGVRTGAAYLDVEGLFSNLNIIYLSTLVELLVMVIVGYSLYRIKQRFDGLLSTEGQVEKPGPGGIFELRVAVQLLAALLAIDLTFFVAVVIRNHLFVAPNEPTVQIPYIERHLAATLEGYRLDDVETVDWKLPPEPLSAQELLASRTVQNAPILPTWVSRLEEPPDIQHYERIEAAGSTLVYGPMLQVYEQEQQLRPYYKFISVDSVRYRVDGQKRMYVSAVRELPSLGFAGPRPWLRHWGSAALMLTHGLGLVMSPVNELNQEGGPIYAGWDIPPKVSHSELEAEPRIYFGEGAKDDYILTNVRHLKELDFATRQFRQESVHRAQASGIAVDSVLKRLIFAWETLDIPQFLFSSFIDPSRTRLQLYRTPLQRVRKIAPFLFIDTNVYAFVADQRTLWMVNGLTTTDNYPYSFREVLGDKADERAVERFPERIINYAEDAVKITIDAYSGDVRLYKIAEDPIVDAWERIYPGLFEPRSAMPAAVEAQLTYPLQWFHVQFDDIYKRYHQTHPLEFYNAEDLWDDADEVLGSIGRGLSEFGTTDQMTFSYEGYNVLLDPADLPPGVNAGAPGDLQYTMLMPFTPEGATNLRSLVLAFQDPGSYGRLVNLRIPQGTFITGPEQADALIDADGQVNQQITLWVRHGSEVIRGHTLLLPVGGDLLYIEPLWISSLQNPLPQIKLLSIVYRDRTTMGTSVAAAIRLLEVSEADEQEANRLPWFEEAQARGR